MTINNLLPGLVRHRPPARRRWQARAKAAGKAVEELRGAARDGDSRAAASASPAEFGAACAFLCSVHAGYIVGQNILLDGGAYPGTF